MREASIVDGEIVRDYLIEGKVRKVGAVRSDLFGFRVGRLEDVAEARMEEINKAEANFLEKASEQGGDMAHPGMVAVEDELSGFYYFKGAIYARTESEN
jgi:hypothetical protein